MGEISVSLNVFSSSFNRYHRHKSGRKSRFNRRNRRSEEKLQPEKEKVLVSDALAKEGLTQRASLFVGSTKDRA